MKYFWNIAVAVAFLTSVSVWPCPHQRFSPSGGSYASAATDGSASHCPSVLAEAVEAETTEQLPASADVLVACPLHLWLTLLPEQASSRVPLARAERIASLVVFARPARAPPFRA